MKLPPTELQLMGYLWDAGQAYLKELVDAHPEPRPAKTTVATMLRRLIDKGAVGFREHGANRAYYALISKNDYLGQELRDTIDNFFGASPLAFASLFTDEARLSPKQLRELQQLIEDKIEDSQDGNDA